MSAVHALEAALGVTFARGSPAAAVAVLRRMDREPRAAHASAACSGFSRIRERPGPGQRLPDEVNRGLRLKKHGNQLLEVLGGRAIHPINVAVGGFYRWPRRDELTALIPDFEWGVQAAAEVVRWVAGFGFPDFDVDYDFVSLVHPDEYPLNEGQIATGDGTVEVAAFDQRFQEFQVPHSTALHARFDHRTTVSGWSVGQAQP